MTKSICIISGGYPTKDNPEYAFIQPLAWAMADAGAQCSVIAPQSVTERVIRHKKSARINGLTKARTAER